MIVDVCGRCPACGAESLHVVKGAGMVHCLAPGCPDSGAAGRLLTQPIAASGRLRSAGKKAGAVMASLPKLMDQRSIRTARKGNIR